jgi:hypothetical protein
LLTILNEWVTLKSEHMFVYFNIERGFLKMTETELDLIKLIRENDNQEEAIVTAVNVILSFLKQRESSEEQAPAVLQALA